MPPFHLRHCETTVCYLLACLGLIARDRVARSEQQLYVFHPAVLALWHLTGTLSPSLVLPAFESIATHHCTYCSPNGETEMKEVGWSSCVVKLANVRAACSQMTTGRGGCIALSRSMPYSCRRTVRGNARCPHFSLAIISVTVQLWI